jgi:hypothetical protein
MELRDAERDEKLKEVELRAAMDHRYAAQTGKQPMGWFACFED